MTPEEFDSLDGEALLAAVKKAGGQRSFSRTHGIPRTTVQNRLYKMRDDPFSHRPAPEACEIADDFSDGLNKYFIFTSAQDGTTLHEPYLRNLEAYVEWLNQFGHAELIIAGFTYNKSLFEDHSKNNIHWPAQIKKYMRGERLRMNNLVDFCGEMNTLPTAVSPLSGFETYTRDKWGIFPHAKIELRSVPTMKAHPAKQIMTTGAITLPNYVPKKAGLKASFHHVFGAVIVELDPEGRFFCRHLIGDDDDGSFYDLDRFIFDGEVTEHHRAKSLTPGDIHVEQIDPQVARVTFGMYPSNLRNIEGDRVWNFAPEPSLIDFLQPEYLFIHDVCDFRRRNHHNIGDPHDRFLLHVDKRESVEGELAEVAMFLSALQDPDREVVVVDSNHDQALLKWLKTADYRNDPANARFFLQCQLASYLAMENGIKRFSIFEWVMKNAFDYKCEDVRFLIEDDSFVVGGVENANHGHTGANGSRGSIKQFARMAAKTTIGHSHAAGITDGSMQTGTSSLMDMGYNRGASSWSWSHALQYQSGKRTLLTIQNGKAHL